jgi:hypothetical protein
MHFPILLIAAIASIPLSHATLADDLSTYLAAHPEQHGVSSSSPKFIDWKTAKSPILPVNSTAEILPVIPKAYIIKLKPGSGLTRRGESAHSLFHKRASDTIDYDTRYEFTDSSLFFGLSIQVNDDANATSLLEIPNVLAVWPVSIFPRPNAVGLANPRTGIYTYEDGTQYLVNATAGSGYNYNSPHKMTDVDRLHDEGIKGMYPKFLDIM